MCPSLFAGASHDGEDVDEFLESLWFEDLADVFDPISHDTLRTWIRAPLSEHRIQSPDLGDAIKSLVCALFFRAREEYSLATRGR